MAESSLTPPTPEKPKLLENNVRISEANGAPLQAPRTTPSRNDYLAAPPHLWPHRRSVSDAMSTRPRSMPAPNIPEHSRSLSATIEAERAVLRPTSNPTPPSRSITYLLPTARHSSAELNREGNTAKMGMGARDENRKSLVSSASRDSGVLNPTTPSSRSCRRDSGLAPTTTSRLSANSANATPRSLRRELSMEDEIASIRLRSLYNSGISGTEAESMIESMRGSGTNQFSGQDERRISMISKTSGKSGGLSPNPNVDEPTRHASVSSPRTSLTSFNTAQETVVIVKEDRSEHEFAGGAEDWEDVEGSDVDRYGFIKPKPGNRNRASISAASTFKTLGHHHRVSTGVFNKTATSRKRTRGSHRHLYKLFHIDHAHDMLNNPLPVSAEKIKAREQKRSDKWREMAGSARALRQAEGNATGGGMFFEFMTEDPKLISRTWKGIPDCWRSMAWHSFLTASANKRGDCLKDEELIEIYQDLLQQSSADDPQIDLDVPRTISTHIMFRRRYRGGQRLLFRVLHAISLHFPDVGYVQGMASLAATLLCYYDEETAFVMLVRLFELRGMARLYTAGFGGLMEALSELETNFLRGGALSQKMEELGISPTAFGTRWYLTLFNYSIPFPAQLRVWDVFMLLGDPDPNSPDDASGYRGLLDIIHATASGIINGMSDIILKSDFETAMKGLTSWVPIKDEDLFMKVVKNEMKKKHKMFSKSSKKQFNRPESSSR